MSSYLVIKLSEEDFSRARKIIHRVLKVAEIVWSDTPYRESNPLIDPRSYVAIRDVFESDMARAKERSAKRPQKSVPARMREAGLSPFSLADREEFMRRQFEGEAQ